MAFLAVCSAGSAELSLVSREICNSDSHKDYQVHIELSQSLQNTVAFTICSKFSKRQLLFFFSYTNLLLCNQHTAMIPSSNIFVSLTPSESCRSKEPDPWLPSSNSYVHTNTYSKKRYFFKNWYFNSFVHQSPEQQLKKLGNYASQQQSKIYLNVPWKISRLLVISVVVAK